jgi:hypothetical protein
MKSFGKRLRFRFTCSFKRDVGTIEPSQIGIQDNFVAANKMDRRSMDAIRSADGFWPALRFLVVAMPGK